MVYILGYGQRSKLNIFAYVITSSLRSVFPPVIQHNRPKIAGQCEGLLVEFYNGKCFGKL